MDGTPTAQVGIGAARGGFAARSHAMRDEALKHGWDMTILGPIMSGVDPEAPTLL